MDEAARLRATIAALQAQAAALGEAVVATAVAPLYARLAALSAVPAVPADESAAEPAAEPTDPPAVQTRRQVTLLFLDVVGSTALSALLDPEEVSELIDGTLREATAQVQAHGGRVLQYAGDNLLAVWGAATTRDDDAERAVQAGLALLGTGRALAERVQRGHGQPGCDVRVGLHTGLVVLGGGVDEEGSIRGLAVNIAARMEQTAPPGTLRISHDTWLLVRAAFDCAAQPPLRVKGGAAPMQTWLVQRARSASERLAATANPSAQALGMASGAAPGQPHLLGRDSERDAVLALLGAARHGGSPQALTLLGEPGIGKSRLLRELQAAVAAAPLAHWLLLARAQPASGLRTHGLLRDLLAWRLGIADSDSAEVARNTLVGGLLPGLVAGGEAADAAAATAQAIGHVVGLDFATSTVVQGHTPAHLRERAFNGLLNWLRGLGTATDDGAKPRVPVLLLEDLQWADAGSLDFVATLLAHPRAPPLALLATARPELLETRPNWPALAPERHAVLHLHPLPGVAAQALASALLHGVAGAAELLRQLVQRTGGNPFFMEELVRMWHDQGVIAPGPEGLAVQPQRQAQAPMPTTVVGVLQTRLDLLPAPQRGALQAASIVGPLFWDQALAALDGQAVAQLPALAGRDLVHAQAHSAFDTAAEHAFRHHLLQQVAYDTVLLPARRRGHAATAAWLAERVGDRHAEFLAITALHYQRAGLHEPAALFYERAATEAAARFANAAALAHASQALLCLPAEDQAAAVADSSTLRRRHALHKLRWQVLDVIGERSAQQLETERRQALAEALDDDTLRAEALMCQALLASRRSDEPAARRWATQAAALASRCGSLLTAAMAKSQLAWSSHALGEPEAALALAEDAVADARAAVVQHNMLDSRTLLAKTLTVLTIVRQSRGLLVPALHSAQEAMAMAQADGLRPLRVSLCTTLAALQLESGDAASALLQYDTATELSAELELGTSQALGLMMSAVALWTLGRPEAALPRLAQAQAISRRIELDDLTARCHLFVGLIHGQARRWADAARELESSSALFAALQRPVYATQADAGLAWVALASGDAAAAAAAADRVAAAHASMDALLTIDLPVLPALLCHRVWRAVGDARADAAIRQAVATIELLAERCGDAALGQRIRNHLPYHREVHQAWGEWQAQAQPQPHPTGLAPPD